jgi:hypothetical protein
MTAATTNTKGFATVILDGSNDPLTFGPIKVLRRKDINEGPMTGGLGLEMFTSEE